MAASITITSGLDVVSPLVSVFNVSCIKFNFDRVGLIGSYGAVLINGIEYKATKVSTAGTVDSYILDTSDILKYILPFPPKTITVSGLTKQLTGGTDLKVIGYHSTGSISANHYTIKLCYGYSKIGMDFYSTWYEGRGYQDGNTIYHQGKIGMCWKEATADYDLSVAGYDDTVHLDYGYNILTLPSRLLGNGTLMDFSGTYPDLSIPLIYKAPDSRYSEEIAWLNADGCWSFWNFRLLSEENAAKSSNEIPIYNTLHSEIKGMSEEISKDKTIKYAFDTIAVDPIHYKQLTHIADSFRVIYDGKLCKVTTSQTLTAASRQNLKFTITLEVQEYVATY